MEDKNKEEITDAEHLAILKHEEGSKPISSKEIEENYNQFVAPKSKPKEKKEREKLPMSFMANEFMDQQLITLNKLIEEKNANDANVNGGTSN